MLLPHGAVIALADGRNFELYRNAGNEAEPKLAALPSPRLDSRNKGSGVHHRLSTGNPQTHLLEEDAHAAAVAEWLNAQVLGNKIETLVVIAAPRTLGELRRHYHKRTEQALNGELSKDLIGRPEDAILDALKGG